MVNKIIRKELIEQDLKISDIAEATGYSRSHVSRVINGRHDSLKLKKIIALVLRKEFNYLWSINILPRQKNKKKEANRG